MNVVQRLKAALSSLLAKASAEGVTDISSANREIVSRVRPYTMTSLPRIVALLDAVEDISRRQIPGAFAECGVWRGGSVMAMALKLQSLGIRDRDLFLYDTFEGMTPPTGQDTSPYEAPAIATWRAAKDLGRRGWDAVFDPRTFNESAVRESLVATGYPPERLHFVVGPVERTLPEHAPKELALLRLDTDWYESTRHELVHLYPRLSPGGVLIVDDYGHWDGCRRAVDEFFAADPANMPLLQRIDYTGRIAVKP